MALKLEENVVQVATGKSLVSRFRTDLPDTGASIAAAGRNFGDTLEESGVRGMRVEAEKAAKDAAGNATIIKDANGKLVRPPAPGAFGAYASRVFDDIVDGNYVGAVQRDFEDGLNEIVKNNLGNEANARIQMQEKLDATLASVEPNQRATLQRTLGDEVLARNRGLGLSIAERTRSSQMDEAGAQADWNMGQATEAFAMGNTELGTQYLTRARDAQLRKRALLSADPKYIHDPNADELFTKQTQAMLAGGQTISDIMEQSNDGRLTPSQVQDTIDMLDGNANPKLQVLGKNMAWFTENMSPEWRQATAARLRKIKDGMGAIGAQQTADAEYHTILDLYEKTGAKLALPGMTAEKRDSFLTRWWKENLSQKTDFFSPESIQTMWEKFGMLPEAAIRDTLKDSAGLGDAKVLEEKYKTYQALEKLSAIGDNGNHPKTDILSGADAAFWATYSSLRNNGHDAISALDAAKQLMADGKKFAAEIGKEGGTGRDIVGGSFKSAYPGRELSEMPAIIDKALGFSLDGAPGAIQFALQKEVETNVKVYGLPFDLALKNAANTINSNWLKDPNILKGWATRAEATPEVTGPDSKPTREWVQPYIDKLLNPGGKAKGPWDSAIDPLDALRQITGIGGQKEGGKDEASKGGKDSKPGAAGVDVAPQLYVAGAIDTETGKRRPIPPGAKLGENLFLVPQGNGRFTMQYEDDHGLRFPVAGLDGHVAVLNLGKAADRLTDGMQQQLADKTAAQRKKDQIEWGPGRPNPAVMKQKYQEAGVNPDGSVPEVSWPDPKATDILVPWQDSTVKDPPRMPPSGKTYLRTLSGGESSHSIYATNPKSTATGLYQVLDGTYAEVRKKHPELNLPETMPDDPAVQQQVAFALTKDNADFLANAHIDPSDRNLAMAHLLGASGGARFLKGLAADPDQKATALVSADAAEKNAAIFEGKTAIQAFHAWADKWEDTHSFMQEASGGLNDGSALSPSPDGQAFLDPRGGAPMDTRREEAVADLVASGRIQPQVDMLTLKPDLKQFSVRLLRAFPELIMTSGYREQGYNAKVNGRQASQHLHANASDFTFAEGTSNTRKKEVMDQILMDPRVKGVGAYTSGSFHIDFRGSKAVWGPDKTSASFRFAPVWFQRSVSEWYNRKST